jgi:hypothetical protein
MPACSSKTDPSMNGLISQSDQSQSKKGSLILERKGADQVLGPSKEEFKIGRII